MSEFILDGDFIKLGQLMKAANLVSNGADAKILIQDGQVLVNGEVCEMRGKKIVRGDVVSFDGQTVTVK